MGEQVRDDLTALPQVSLAELTAVRPYEISIEISETTLDRYALTFDDIVNAIRRSSLDLPAGSVKTRTGEILLRTKGQAYTGKEFEEIVVVTRPDGTRLTLGDIATVRDGFEEDPLYGMFNGKPAVLIEVYRTGDQNALEVGRAVKDYIAEKRVSMPPAVTVDYWRDRSRIVKLRLNTLVNTNGNTTSAVFGELMCHTAVAAKLGGIVVLFRQNNCHLIAQTGDGSHYHSAGPKQCRKPECFRSE